MRTILLQAGLDQQEDKKNCPVYATQEIQYYNNEVILSSGEECLQFTRALSKG